MRWAHKLRHGVPSSGASSYAGVPIYFLCYFILVPGALFSYRTNMPQRLSILVGSGLSFFWRFVRITLLAVLVSGLVLGPLFALQNAWMNHVDEQVVGVSAVYHDLVGWVVIALVAALLRVYFDLVEVYTVQLDDRLRENGKPDRRVRKVLVPAARTLWANFWRVYGLFWYTTIKGIVALAIVGYIAVESLAQPRVWPSFLLLQLGFFLNTLTRYWMRAAETVLIADFPLPSVPSELTEAFTSSDTVEPSPAVIGTERDLLDAIPSPEPAVPSEAQPSPEAPSV